MTTLATLKAVAPELNPGDDSADARLNLFLEMAVSRLHARAWGNVYEQAVVYLAAHLITLSNRASEDGTAAPGALATITTGDQSRSFASRGAPSLSTEDAALATTTYGEQFLALRATRVARAPRVIGVC